MSFSNLFETTDECPGDRRFSVGAAKEISERFEALVQRSQMRYWRPGMPFNQVGGRLLVGLAPMSSLIELRLADLLNEQVGLGTARCQVDVFNLLDIHGVSDTARYFTQEVNIASTPVVGFWQNGKLVELYQGGNATIKCLERVGISGSFQSIVGRLCPEGSALWSFKPHKVVLEMEKCVKCTAD